MKIAISNLAWQPPQDKEVFELLKTQGINGIELAPTKYFPDLSQTDKQKVGQLKKQLVEAGLETVAFQSILFGRPDLKVFGEPEMTEKTLKYLENIATLASTLGAKILVFGSPKHRLVPSDWTQNESWKAAIDFFWKAAHRCHSHGVALCIEPNPVVYGCNFITNTKEAARLVREIDHPGLRLLLDLGGSVLNGEDIGQTIKENADITAHFHISEPRIKPISPDNPNHAMAAEALKEVDYDKWVSIEMLPPPEGTKNIQEVLDFVKKTYFSCFDPK